jgi:hypothetical protein
MARTRAREHKNAASAFAHSRLYAARYRRGVVHDLDRRRLDQSGNRTGSAIRDDSVQGACSFGFIASLRNPDALYQIAMAVILGLCLFALAEILKILMKIELNARSGDGLDQAG